MLSEYQQQRRVVGNTDREDFTCNRNMNAFRNNERIANEDKEEELCWLSEAINCKMMTLGSILKVRTRYKTHLELNNSFVTCRERNPRG